MPEDVSPGSLESTSESLRAEAWDLALHSMATARIFERRAKLLKLKLRLLSFTGLAVPLTIGGLVISYGVGFRALPLMIAIGSAITVAQGVVSLWSLTSTWVESYDTSIESIINNRALAQAYEELAKAHAIPDSDYQSRFEILKTRDDVRRATDYKQGVTEDEKRFGMRAALVRYRRRCAGCDIQPTNMIPTNCGVCGDFSKRRFKPGK